MIVVSIPTVANEVGEGLLPEELITSLYDPIENPVGEATKIGYNSTWVHRGTVVKIVLGRIVREYDPTEVPQEVIFEQVSVETPALFMLRSASRVEIRIRILNRCFEFECESPVMDESHTGSSDVFPQPIIAIYLLQVCLDQSGYQLPDVNQSDSSAMPEGLLEQMYVAQISLDFLRKVFRPLSCD
ncbi:hypothetical protein C0J52_13777 [Blattella germanica]|nr:hypothetical protein C0J52_13777 [Blattella germanica]